MLEDGERGEIRAGQAVELDGFSALEAIGVCTCVRIRGFAVLAAPRKRRSDIRKDGHW